MKKKIKHILAYALIIAVILGTIPANLTNANAQSTDDYGQVGAYEAYSIQRELYENGKKLKTGNEMIYIRENPKGGTNSEGQIVYCFNADRAVPDIKLEAPDYRGENYTDNTLLTYTKVAGTPETFSKLATAARGNAREEILKVLYNGYRTGEGNRLKEIQDAFKAKYPDPDEKGNFSEAEFYAATQKAIWYYTDGYELVKKSQVMLLLKMI